MKVWLLKQGESLPFGENAKNRRVRTAEMAYRLSRAGHQATWWTSTFDHQKRIHHAETSTTRRTDFGFEVSLLRTMGYESSKSPKRFLDHSQTALTFLWEARKREKPDILVASYPSIDLAHAATVYGRLHGVPVVVDLRDMWPDIFYHYVSERYRPLLKPVLALPEWTAKRTLKSATAITGITDAFVEWGLRKAGRSRTAYDRSFPHAYPAEPPSDDALNKAKAKWDALGFPENSSRFTACFVGSMSYTFDLDVYIQAARILHRRGLPMQFICCGDGERLEEYRAKTADLPTIHFPGWVNAAEIWTLLRRSQVGLTPLPDRFDYLATINNKAIEYLSAGLPLVHCPAQGVLADLVNKEEIGLCHGYDDAQAVVTCLESLAGDAEQYRTKAERAASLFEKRFKADVVYGGFIDLLEELVANKTPSKNSLFSCWR